jgi:hypothetical protein
MTSYRGPPMTLGNAAAARVRLIVWCLDCRHQVEPDPAAMAERGASPWQRTGGTEIIAAFKSPLRSIGILVQ